MSTQHPLEDVLDKAVNDIDRDQVHVRDLLDLYGDRSFGPVFTILGLMIVIPFIGGIPGLPSVLGVVIILFLVQMLLGRDHIWLPEFIERRSIGRDKLQAAKERSAALLQRVDGLTDERFTWAVSDRMRYVAAVLVTVLAACLPPVEFVPFAALLPGAAIMLIGVALMAYDGALMLLGFLIAGCGAAGLAAYFLL